MAIIKCKMCGGDLILEEGSNVAECAYCGSRQTVPSADNEKKLNLFARANRLRANNEFDKAAGVYEAIVADFPEEAEAYWGLILCKYGIEYVDDPATGKKIPTCHRSSFDSVMDDANFELVMENADPIARRVYREEAKQLEELRKGIIEVSSKEEPYDIFICYKETDEKGDRTLDSVLAQDVYDMLTENGYRVFFSRVTLEDKLGQEYEPYIFAALNSAKIMLAFGTDYDYYNAVWVKNEWSRFLQLIAKGEKKTLIPCYKNLDAYDMPKEFAKLQAQDLGKVGANQDLLRGIKKILPQGEEKLANQQTMNMVVQQTVLDTSPNVSALLKRGYFSLEDKQWDKAKECFEQVLNLDAENHDAYLGLVMSETKLPNREAFRTAFVEGSIEGITKKEKLKIERSIKICPKCLRPIIIDDKNSNGKCKVCGFFEEEKPADSIDLNLKRAIQFADSEQAVWWKTLYHNRKEKEAEDRKAQEDNNDILQTIRKKIAPAKSLISFGCAGYCYLYPDGSVTNDSGSILYPEKSLNNHPEWKNIVAVSGAPSDFEHCVGLRADGTVVAAGSNKYGQCNVQNWTHIVAVFAGGYHTVGLKADGTVVAVGNNDNEQCNVSSWKDIVAVSAGDWYTIGVKKDGTAVVAEGESVPRYISLGTSTWMGWKELVDVSAQGSYALGLKYNGTVVVAGLSDQPHRDGYAIHQISEWRDIVAISAGECQAVGLKKDGTVVYVTINNPYEKGEMSVLSEWRDIVGVAAGIPGILGIKSDGTVVAASNRKRSGISASERPLFHNLEKLDQERQEARELRRAEFEREKSELNQEIEATQQKKTSIANELSSLRGVFSGKRRKELNAELEAINNHLAELHTKLSKVTE